MTESTLKEFLKGYLSIEELRSDIEGTVRRTSHDVFSYKVETITEGNYQLREDHILKLCNEAIIGNLDSSELDIISFALLGSNYFNWDSDRITEILTDWNNQTINFPITQKNLELWKDYLKTGEYRLPEFNNWNFHIESQQKICQNSKTDWKPINKKLNIGLGGNLSEEPINGLRHPADHGMTGWFIWTGKYSEKDDFFKPLCAEHLLQLNPELIKFLGLPPGYRFLTDSKGYLDIWKDEKLLNE